MVDDSICVSSPFFWVALLVWWWYIIDAVWLPLLLSSCSAIVLPWLSCSSLSLPNYWLGFPEPSIYKPWLCSSCHGQPTKAINSSKGPEPMASWLPATIFLHFSYRVTLGEDKILLEWHNKLYLHKIHWQDSEAIQIKKNTGSMMQKIVQC